MAIWNLTLRSKNGSSRACGTCSVWPCDTGPASVSLPVQLPNINDPVCWVLTCQTHPSLLSKPCMLPAVTCQPSSQFIRAGLLQAQAFSV